MEPTEELGQKLGDFENILSKIDYKFKIIDFKCQRLCLCNPDHKFHMDKTFRENHTFFSKEYYMKLLKIKKVRSLQREIYIMQQIILGSRRRN